MSESDYDLWRAGGRVGDPPPHLVPPHTPGFGGRAVIPSNDWLKTGQKSRIVPDYLPPPSDHKSTDES